MNQIINLNDFVCESEEWDPSARTEDFVEEDQEIFVEQITDDVDALIHLGEEAFNVLATGLHHRKQAVRTRSITLMAQLFPQKRTSNLFRRILLDRREKRVVRFHAALNMIFHEEHNIERYLQDLRTSKGCNDRICAAILMGGLKKPAHLFLLIHSLRDSNDCVKIAAFLSLLNFSRGSVMKYLGDFIEEATVFQLKLLEKNIRYYESTTYFSSVLQSLNERLEDLKSHKVAFHPEYYEQSYSQEKLSKLDRIDDFDQTTIPESLTLFEG